MAGRNQNKNFEVILRPTACTSTQVFRITARHSQVNADGTLVFFDFIHECQPDVKAAFRAHCWMTVQDVTEVE